MTVAQTGIVDWMGIESVTGHVSLTVVDDLDWTDEQGHLLLLQQKLNNYLAFIESGEVFERIADETGRSVADCTPVAVSILAKFALPPRAQAFVEHAKDEFSGAGLRLSHRVLLVR